ncbi:MAG: hypothetical protein Q9226_002747 [Calogaya cf. arnoldii]
MMKRVVTSLESLIFYIATHTEVDTEHSAMAEAYEKLSQQGRFLDLFGSVPCLQVLWICCESWIESAERIDLRHVVGDIYWCKLRDVSINGFKTTSEGLLQFFQSHVKTLKAVKLENIRLLQGSWPNILRSMRTSLTLEKFYFGYSFLDNWDWGLAMEIRDYVLGEI